MMSSLRAQLHLLTAPECLRRIREAVEAGDFATAHAVLVVYEKFATGRTPDLLRLCADRRMQPTAAEVS